MDVSIKIVDPLENFADAEPLLLANWRESKSVIEFNPADVRTFYESLGNIGFLFAAGAYDGDKLIGYGIATIYAHPFNKAVDICNVDGIYLLPEYRGSTIAPRLMRSIENVAKERRAKIIQWHAPVDSPFSKALSERYTPFSNYYQDVIKYEETRIVAMNSQAINKVRAFEDLASKLPQVPLVTTHTIHGGIYSRTVTIPAGVTITGALIKIATTLIISGKVRAFVGEETIELQGYNVIAASAGRKQAFLAIDDTNLTMLFATNATTIEQAENEFTDEAHLLASRLELSVNNVIITGE